MRYNNIVFRDSGSKEFNKIRNDYFLEGEQTYIEHFPGFTSINIIIGANNSGKSRFMRYFMAQEEFLGIADLQKVDVEIESYNKEVENFNYTYIDLFIEKYKNSSYNKYGHSIENTRTLLLKHRLQTVTLKNYQGYTSTIENNKESLKKLGQVRSESGYFIKNDFLSNYSEVPNDFLKKFSKIKRYYIPTLRTAHSIFEVKENSYKKIEKDIYYDTLKKTIQLKILMWMYLPAYIFTKKY